MKILITGGVGFIGRWVVKYLLKEKHDLWIIDNLCNAKEDNLIELCSDPHFKKFIKVDIKNKDILHQIFQEKFDLCLHLAAAINVQLSLDNPKEIFETNVEGSFNILEEARRTNTKVILMSTCMVYDKAKNSQKIDENHSLLPRSPYAASKITAENLALSYYYSYGLPVAVLRPFNTYGPYQRIDGEGGVISCFIANIIFSFFIIS